MKLTKVFSAIIALTALFLTSCDKDVETSSVVLEKCDSAKIIVNVYADLNLKTAGEELVSGAQVLAYISNSEFNNSGAKGEWQKYFTTDAQGFVTIVVPTDNDGVTVSLKLADKKMSEIQQNNSVVDSLVKVFKTNTFSVSVKPKTIAYQELRYSSKVLVPTTTFVTVTGFVVADIDSIGGTNLFEAPNDYVTTPMTIKFYTDGADGDWSTTVTTVQKTGVNINNDSKIYTEFTVSVPKSVTIKCEYKVTLSKIISKGGGTVKNWKQDYIYENTNVSLNKSSFTKNTSNVYLTLDDSQKTAVIFLK